MKAKYQSVASLHIYSLGPSLLQVNHGAGPAIRPFLICVGQNLQILADENKYLTVRYVIEGSVDRIKHYGAIHNMRVQVCRSTAGMKAANLAPQKDLIGGRPNSTITSLPDAVPAKIPRSYLHEDTLTGSQKTDNSVNLSSTTKTQAQNDLKLENRSQSLPKSVKTAANKIHGVRKEPSDIFKPFSHPNLKSDSGGSNSSVQTDYELGNLQSVREETISGPL